MSDWDKFWEDFFTYSGRLSRRRFNKHILKVWLPLVVFWVMDFLIADVFELTDRLPHLAFVIAGFLIFSFLSCMVCFFIFTLRRLHDLNYSGWWTVLPILIFFSSAPLTGVLFFVFGFWLGHKDGTQGKNKYGDPPPDD